MFAIAAGDPFDGLVLYGPFDSAENANDYADTELSRIPWWVLEIQKPGRKAWSPRSTAPEGLFVAASGDAFRGITLHGPFDGAASAKEWADAHGAVTTELLQEP